MDNNDINTSYSIADNVMSKTDLIELSTDTNELLKLLNRFVGKGRSVKFEALANTAEKKRDGNTSYIYDFSWSYLVDTAKRKNIYYSEIDEKWKARSEGKSIKTVADVPDVSIESATPDKITKEEPKDTSKLSEMGTTETERTYVIHLTEKITKKKTSMDVDETILARWNCVFEEFKNTGIMAMLYSSALDSFITDFEAGKIGFEP